MHQQLNGKDQRQYEILILQSIFGKNRIPELHCTALWEAEYSIIRKEPCHYILNLLRVMNSFFRSVKRFIFSFANMLVLREVVSLMPDVGRVTIAQGFSMMVSAQQVLILIRR